MEIKITKGLFLKGLSKVVNIIPAREIRSTLSNILIEAKNNNITLTASDFEITISIILKGEVIKDGAVAVPARMLSQIVNELQAEDISLSVVENNNIKIRGGISEKTNPRFSLMGFSTEDYPLVPPAPEDTYKEISKNLVTEMFNHVAYAMAKEDARYVFNGLYIIPEGKVATFITTDGRRLSLIRKEFPVELPFEESIILPHKTVREIQKLSDEEGELSLAYNSTDKRIHIKVKNISITSKLIEGNFPDHKQVVPKKVEYEILINKEALENSIRQVAVMASEPTLQVRFSFEKNKLYLNASTPDIGESEDNLVIEYNNEEKIETAFNSRYILEILKVLETENIIFGISSSASPVSIQKPGDKDFMAIVMPMKI